MTGSLRGRTLDESGVSTPSLSVVLPAYNETHRLPETLATLQPFLTKYFPTHEVIVVDDGSTDGTADLVRSVSRTWPKLQVLEQPRNLGKGAAVKRGMLAAKMDLVMFMDSDLATPIEEIADFLPHFESGVPAVVGVRTYQQDESKWRRVLGLSLQIIAHIIVFENAVVDSQCGFKIFTREAAQQIFSLVRVQGGMFDVEIFAIMHRQKISPHFQPVRWVNKAGSRINILRCMVFDIVDMAIIRFNTLMGYYNSQRAVRFGRNSMRA